MQYSLCLVVAAVRALVSGSLAGNAWLIHPRDEEVDVAPHADGAPDPALTFPCTGVHYADGSMADDVTLNWIVTSITAIAQSRRHPIPLDDAQLAFAGEIFRLTEGLPTLREVQHVLGSVHRADGTPYALARLPDVPGVPRDISGRPVNAAQALSGAFISPVLSDITGPAVDDGVVYPAQYGSPDLLTEGWYWSATVDTRQTGIHRLDLHLDIYRPIIRDRCLDFVPERYVLPTWLDVRAVPAVNGFTGGPIGYLPLPYVPVGTPSAAPIADGGPADA